MAGDGVTVCITAGETFSDFLRLFGLHLLGLWLLVRSLLIMTGPNEVGDGPNQVCESLLKLELSS